MTMNAERTLVSVLLWFILALPAASAQNVELTAHVGGQINGGLDLATSLFHRTDW